MTYCLGIKLEGGVVMLSDTRTNAGLDNIARFGKMFTWEDPGRWVVCMCTAGNLSITQGVVTAINAGIKTSGGSHPSIFAAGTMYDVAQIIGENLRGQIEHHSEALTQAGASMDASLLLTGQRAGGELRLFLVYAAGNAIEATEDSPFFQIGEHKYGKPILDRALTYRSEVSLALKAAYLSMDSTIRSNLSVALPLDLAVIRPGALTFETRRRIEDDDPGFAAMSRAWSQALLDAFADLPDVM